MTRSGDDEGSLKASYGIPDQVLYREVDGQMVLLDLDTERYFGLNQVGADIVARLIRQPFEQALEELANDYDVDPSVLRKDVDSLLAALIDAGLLGRRDGHG